MKQTKALFLILILLATGCTKKSPTGSSFSEDSVRGERIATKTLSTYTSAQIQNLIALAGFNSPDGLEYSVKIVSITYVTLDGLGEKVQASGALMIPQELDNLPLMSLQHGTEIERDNVASVSPVNSVEGMAGTILASLGYLTCVPDYVGLGVSKEMHPYIHAQSLSVSVIDFIRAVRDYCDAKDIALNGQIFLAGYSEGGYATLATQKEIEENYAGEFDLTAVAPMAGPYDLATMMHDVFQNADYTNLNYISFILTAWDYIYGWNRLDDFFNEPYASKMVDLFDGSKSWGEIAQELPNTFNQLVKNEFTQSMRNGTETDVPTAAQENTLLDWAPIAPVRLYHGDADQIVPYQNATTALNNLTNAGGVSVELITIPGGTHSSSVEPTLLDVIEWFDGFRQPPLAKHHDVMIVCDSNE